MMIGEITPAALHAALSGLSQRQRVTADNIANINTPGFLAGRTDFETALGGAAHMGRRDIAEFLLEHNARIDIFAATMLGQTEIVKAAVAAFPKIVHVPGPHGIPLIVHAQKGGPAAAAVLDFLRPLVAPS